MRIIDIKSIYNRNKTIVANFGYLSVFQVINLLIPLVTYPYLIRKLGIEIYGAIIFSQAIISYFVILINFGFNFSATKQISINRDNESKLLEIINAVFTIKTALLLLSFIILFLILNFLPDHHLYKTLYIITMWMALYECFFPIWYFQGIEKMKYITILTLISRSIFVILIFILVNKPTDYLLVPIINGIGAIASSTIALIIIYRKNKFYVPKLFKLIEIINESIFIFISNVSTKLYVSASKTIIGFYLGNTQVAYFDLGEKLLQFLKIPVMILGQSTFPKLSKTKNIKLANKLLKISIIGSSIVLLIVLLFLKKIILLIGGVDMLPAQKVAGILVFSIIFVASNAFLVPYRLIPFGYNKDFAKVTFYSFCTYLLFIVILILFDSISITNLSVSNLIVEFVVLILGVFYSRKRDILY
ncbi:MAG: oligosaccharide flippase family protein [Prolixibacteraceae bacterium]